MPKGGKKYVKPGCLAANTTYERLREKNINANNEMLKALGCKQLAISHFGSARPKCTKKTGKKSMDTEYDVDYIPSDGEGDDDDDSSDSLVHEVSSMPPRKRLTFSEPPNSLSDHQSNPTPEGVSLSVDQLSLHHVDDRGNLPNDSMETPSNEPQCSSAGSITRRGVTRGIGIQRVFEKDGKLPILIPEEFRQPVGKYAASFASATGVQIRQHLADVGVLRWSKVPITSVEPIIQRLNDKFDLQGDPNDVRKATNTKLGKRLSDWSSKNYKKYREIRDKEGESYARSHPPKGVNSQQWIQFIDGKWNTPEFQRQSAANTANRARVKMNHSCGSKSMLTRFYKQVEDNEGAPVDYEEFWHSCHFNVKKNKWANPECERGFEKLKKVKEDHLSQPDATPLTAEMLSVMAFGATSGRLKGLGMRPSSSYRTMGNKPRDSEYVKNLEERITQLESTNQSQDEQMVEKTKQMEDQMQCMLEWMRSKGYDGPGSLSNPSGASWFW